MRGKLNGRDSDNNKIMSHCGDIAGQGRVHRPANLSGTPRVKRKRQSRAKLTHRVHRPARLSSKPGVKRKRLARAKNIHPHEFYNKTGRARPCTGQPGSRSARQKPIKRNKRTNKNTTTAHAKMGRTRPVSPSITPCCIPGVCPKITMDEREAPR